MNRPLKPSTIRIGLLQHACGPDPQENLERALEAGRIAAAQGAQILCTQELFTTRYFCQVLEERFFDLAEPIPGPTTRRLQDLARQTSCVVIGSLFERQAPGLYYNSAVVIDADGTLLGRYRKMHIPHDPQFEEKFYFTPGDLGIRAWKTRYGTIGVLICWDQWFPEAARLAALAGAEILFYPTAIGWLPGEKEQGGEQFLHAWQIMLQSHAIANGCYIAAVNRVGWEPRPNGTENASSSGIEFWGSSLVIGPLGEILAQAPEKEPSTLVVEIDRTRIETVRRQWPFLRDRRIDAYHGLLRRFLEPDNPHPEL